MNQTRPQDRMDRAKDALERVIDPIRHPVPERGCGRRQKDRVEAWEGLAYLRRGWVGLPGIGHIPQHPMREDVAVPFVDGHEFRVVDGYPPGFLLVVQADQGTEIVILQASLHGPRA